MSNELIVFVSSAQEEFSKERIKISRIISKGSFLAVFIVAQPEIPTDYDGALSRKSNQGRMKPILRVVLGLHDELFHPE